MAFAARIRKTPAIIEINKQKIIAIGDLHGDREMFWAIMMSSGCIGMNKSRTTPKWTGKNTIVVILGDTTDSKRPDVKIKKQDAWFKTPGERRLQYDILDFDYMAKQKGGRVISILGNHDIFAGIYGDDYCKKKDIDSYGKKGIASRREAYSPGGEIATIFGQTRNVIQIVGPCLFVHGGITAEFMQLFPFLSKDTITVVNDSMKDYLLGNSNKLPDWFEASRRFGVNPIEYRRYGIGDVDKKEVSALLKTFPGKIKYMFVGHTVNQTISRFGPVICVDVGISRAFGEKSGDIACEWCEISENKVSRCILEKTGKIVKKKLPSNK